MVEDGGMPEKGIDETHRPITRRYAMAGKSNKDMMSREFASIGENASLKEAFEAIMKNLAGPPHSPGLVVLNKEGLCTGLLTVDDFMRKLGMLYNDACDRPGEKDWGDRFFNQCEIAGMEKVSGIMSGKGIMVDTDVDFDQSCELILSKNLHMLPVVETGTARVAGIITRRKVIEELGPKMFR
jgi:CBS domain-containing protein